MEEQVRFLSSDVARKADIEALKTKIEQGNTQIERVRTEIEKVRTETSDKMGTLVKQQMGSIRWTVGVAATVLSGLVVALIKLLP